MRLAPGVHLGAYVIADTLGAGGMGEVYRARDTRLGRDVAIKVLPAALATDPAALARFEREARAVAALSHPSILAIFDVGSTDGVAYTVTELLEGETLRARLTQGPLSVRRTIEAAIQIAEGLGAAHEKGIVHRDLKPENLFLTNDGRIKILDFGLAQETPAADPLGNSPTLARHTEPGTVLGTVGYMSPEQVRGLQVDARSDIFSFGAVLYEMVSGRRAFGGDSAVETMHAILREDPPGLAETKRTLPPALERIVHHCLEKRPEQRFQSAHDLAFDLQAIAASSGTTAALVPPRPVRWTRALGVVALVAAGGVLGMLATRMVGGTPSSSPTYRRLTYDRGVMGHARFAPDGNTVVYSAEWRGERSEVFTTPLNGRGSRAFGVGPALLQAVSSTGELAVGLDAYGLFGALTLARVPLAGGAPREVVDRVTFADWSADGSDLAVVRRLEETIRIEFPIGTAIYATKDNVSHLRVSPQGDWVAFIEHPVSSILSSGSLVVIDRHGTKRVLSTGWGDLFGVAWGPDGHEVWFTAAHTGEYKALRAVTLDGRERVVARMLGQIDLEDVGRDGRVLLTHPDFRRDVIVMPPGGTKERELSWLGLSALADLSNDGSIILFTESPEGAAEGDVTYLRKSDGSAPALLGRGTAMALSPDRKWALSFTTSPVRLVLLPTGVGAAKTLPGPELTSVPGGAWFPDSRRVLLSASVAGQPARVYVQDIDGGERSAFGPPGLTSPSVSPDGLTVAAVLQGRLVLLPADGGNVRPCPGALPEDRPIRWSADGRVLFVARWIGLVAEISSLDVVTGRRTHLWNLGARDPAGASPPNVRLSADGKSYAYSFYRSLGDLYLVEGLK